MDIELKKQPALGNIGPWFAILFAPVAGILAATLLLFVFFLSALPWVRPSTVIMLELHVLLLATMSLIYAYWNIIGARIFAVTSTLTFFAPLGFLLSHIIEQQWDKIFPNHLLLLCCYVGVGITAPVVGLLFVQRATTLMRSDQRT